MKTTPREDLARAAGFYDGEGNCNLPPCAPPVVKVVQCGKHAEFILKRFKAAVRKLGAVYGPYKTKRQKSGIAGSPKCIWQSKNFEEAQAVMAMLYGFAGPAKQEQFVKCFGGYKRRRQEKPQGWHVSGTKLPVHECVCGRKIRGPSFWQHSKFCIIATLHR